MREPGICQRENPMDRNGRQAAYQRLEHRLQYVRGVTAAPMDGNMAAKKIEHVDFDTLTRMRANHRDPPTGPRSRDRIAQAIAGSHIQHQIDTRATRQSADDR